MQRIESMSNDKVKLAVKVATSSRYRRQSETFFLEGVRLCRDAVLSGYEPECVFVSDYAAEKFAEDVNFITASAKQSFVISESVEKKITQAQTPQGVFCICRKKKLTDRLDYAGKYIALENVQDPSNLGAIFRTAEALGIRGAITYNCCDIYNPKALRSAMGSALRFPVIESSDLKETLVNAENNGMKVYATTPDSNAQKIILEDLSGGVIAVIGNEGNGVSDEIFSVCKKITIPMGGRAESLNASMAAAITMWEMVRNG